MRFNIIRETDRRRDIDRHTKNKKFFKNHIPMMKLLFMVINRYNEKWSIHRIKIFEENFNQLLTDVEKKTVPR